MRKLRTFKCEICKKIFERRTAEAIVCSNRECQHEWQRRGVNKALLEESYRCVPCEKIPELVLEDVLVFCDPHCPRQHTKWMMYMLDEAEREGIKRAVCIGDLWDWDELSHYTRFSEGMKPMETLLSGVSVCNAIVKRMDRLDVVMTNHDIRPMRRLADAGFVAPFEFMHKVIERFIDNDKVKYHLHTNLIIHTSQGQYWCVHPDSYSRIVPQVERRLAEKKHCHVIGSHGHLFGVGLDISAKFLTTQIGCCIDESKVEYKNEKVTTHPEWTRGFAIIKGGKIKPYLDHPAWRN